MSDMAREGLFASLGERVGGARCLDLFAGSGAVGIEALSRGAEEAVFVERRGAACALIGENLRRAKLESAGRIVRAEAVSWLTKHAGAQGVFDLVTADPPYELVGDPLDAVLAALETGWLAPEGWTVVLTRGHKSSPPAVPVHWNVRRQLRYGDSLLILYREERWA
jgi:16S rRNA (guanine966-N2)-methyltransferase